MTTNKLDEIEGRLKAATPEPWKWDCGVMPPDGPETYADIYADDGDLIIAQFNDQITEGRANARLITNAHSDIAYLLSRVRELEADLESTIEGQANAIKAATDAIFERDRLRAILDAPVTEEELKKALDGWFEMNAADGAEYSGTQKADMRDVLTIFLAARRSK